MALDALRAGYVRKVQRRTAFSVPFVTSGLSAFFDSTKQAGTEAFVLETIAGSNATHHNSPTWDATHKLWTYNGTNQSSTVSSNAAPFGAPNGRGSYECVLIVAATQNHTFSRPMALNGFAFVLSTPTGLTANWTLQPSGSGALPSAVAIADGVPIHVVWTCDGSSVKCYLNGALAKSVASTSLLNAAAGMFAFGTGTGGSAQFFTGSAGWARIYNDAALTAAQVALNYNQAKTVFPALP